MLNQLYIAMVRASRRCVPLVTVVALCSGVAAPTYAQQGLSSLRSAFEQDVPSEAADVTEEFFERTVVDERSPKLNTEIPDAQAREEGPRILVKGFEFERLEEFPEEGITREDVESRAEALRVKYMKEDRILGGGYTEEELVELANFLNEVGAQTSADNVTFEDMQQLLDIVKEQNYNRGVSYADLEEITGELTRFYREQGLFLAKVQIPAQDVEGGVIKLSVMEGRLGNVVAENNKRYKDDLLLSPFIKNKGELVSHEQIEEGLYLLNDLPGLNVAGYFTAGDKPGETQLNLNVREEKTHRIAIRADNHGSRFTGDHRLYVIGDWYNPSGYGDSLTVGYLKSKTVENDFSGLDEGGSDLGQFKYSIPLFNPRTRVGFSADYNEFEVCAAGDQICQLNVEGVNASYALSLDHKFYRSRDFNFSSGFALTDKKTETTGNGLQFNNETHVQGGEVNFYIDGLGESVRMLNMASVKLAYGEHQADDVRPEVNDFRDDELFLFGLDTNSLFFVPLPFVDAESRIILRSHGLYSEQALPGFEQYSLGGANGVRAFSVRDFSADQAGLISGEWYFDLPSVQLFGDHTLNDVLQFGVFAESAYGVALQSQENGQDEWAALSAAGLVMKLNWGESFASKFSFATPIMNKSSGDTDVGDDADDLQIFFDLTYFM